MLVMGCGSTNNDSPKSDAGPLVTCENDPRVVAYTPNLAKQSELKTFTATLVSADPAPPAVSSENTWEVRIADASGAPIDANVTVEPYMPDHGHSPSTNVQITAKGGGAYEFAKVNFFMPGVWWVTITVPTADAGASTQADFARFVFCLPG